MNQILFVCLGNICRSPLAEGILRHKARMCGVNIIVDSAGIGDWHVGQNPDKRAIEVAQKRGIDIAQRTARQMSGEDFEKFDKILVTDAEVYDGVTRLAFNPSHKMKIDYIMNLVYPGLNMPVPDPYYGGVEGFERVFDMLNLACEKIIAYHLEK